MDTSEFIERRRMHRHAMLKHGKILRSGNFPESICRIRNMTPYGAELSIGAKQEIPQEFLLYVRVDDKTYKCRQRWREQTRLGVEVLETVKS